MGPSARERRQERRLRRDPTERRIRVFEQRYGRMATNLAAHAAFPLTLTTDVIYCLRESFLPDCPWYAAADVLLSGLCTPVGYDLYEMEAATRRYLLRYLRDQFGDGQVEAVADFMAAYLRHRVLGLKDNRALMLGEKPQWTALACLQPGKARDEIYQALQHLARQQTLDQQDRFRLASLVESYGDFLADQGYQHFMVEWADKFAEEEPIDAQAEMVEQLQNAGFSVRWVEFEVATVAFGVEQAPMEESELYTVNIETVTVNEQGEEIAREPHTVSYFEELLGDPITPLRLVAIPSGEFMMGSGEEDSDKYGDETPQHLVKVKPFFISQYPVTQAQWKAVAAMPTPTEDLEEDLKPEPSRFSGDERPVEQVSWHEAVEFCARLSKHTGRIYRLPTEAEWEYACRADTTTPYYFGPKITEAWVNYNVGETTSVGKFPPNAFGLYDMHGNVCEWCADHWHGNYEEDGGPPTDGSAWLTEDSDARRVNRGGSWYPYPRLCRSACRDDDLPGDHYDDIGFRVVCEARGL
ncbi:MAG: formylglycine-generating enzyme family protein [Cyanobacteria bacterium P01_E01_bin.6]